MTDKFTCDTSVIFNGQILKLIEDGDLGDYPEIFIPNIVIAEVEYRTNIKREIGFFGLKVLNQLRKLNNENKIKLNIVGKRPSREEIKMAPGGELDALIRTESLKNGTILITSDRIQGEIGRFEGLEVIYAKAKILPKEQEPLSLKLLEFFDEKTMSVHLKSNLPPYAKKGSPKGWTLEKVDERSLPTDVIDDIAIEIIEKVREDTHSFIEIEKQGAVVVQLREFRIVITRPPFSKDLEITAVRPLVNKSLSDYAIDQRLRKRLEKAEGILVCGSPGAGKSTFSAALANFYMDKNKIVKTLESVRDLQVRPEITQYTKLEGSLENSADILLLVRPDFTIFDEVRVYEDFKIFSDFRLSGVGMVGVVHSASAIDAIQRFIGRIELGMLPSIIDTIIFIEGGDITKVMVVNMTVKVPTGFRDEDLARPVVEVRDFHTHQLAFELYSFGQDVVVNPINPLKSKKSKRRSKDLSNFSSFERNPFKNERIELNITVENDKLNIQAAPEYASHNIDIVSDEKLIFTGSLSRKSEMSLSISNKEGKKLLKEIENQKEVYGRIK